MIATSPLQPTTKKKKPEHGCFFAVAAKELANSLCRHLPVQRYSMCANIVL
jgi:hypothetical protein